MILDRVVQLYETVPDLVKRRAPGKGNPTASAAGNCAAALEMLRYPELTHPEMRPVRTAWVFEDGDRHAADLKDKLARAFPGMGGLSEELFYFPVPVTPEQRMSLTTLIESRRLWGTLRPGFLPPHIAMGQNGSKDTMRLAPRDPRDSGRPQSLGFVIDPAVDVLWVPLYVDHILRHQGLGRLVLVEFKSMSRFGFRRALLGDVGYRERVQLAMMHAATGLDCCWFIKNKDTGHLLEIAFLSPSDGARRTRVSLLRSNGRQEVYWVTDAATGAAVPETGGDTVELREDDTWEVAEVWTPRDPALLAQARARILKVLLFTPPTDPVARLLAWDREYGPGDFRCPVCQGTGTQTLRKGSREPLKKAKPCEDCAGSGLLEEAPLPVFPCGYCATVATCWPMARKEITDRPRFIVRRADIEASGLTFHPPEGALPVEETPLL